MDIAVCVKIVPDPSIVTLGEKHRLDPGDIVHMANPSDMAALEQALRILDSGRADGVAVVSIAPPSADAVLRRCLAMGASRVVRLWDECLDTVYNDAVGTILARMLEQFPADLILCGHAAADDEMGYTGYAVAAALGAAFVQNTVDIELPDGGRILVTARAEGGRREKIAAQCPLVVGIAGDLCEPRTPRATAMMSAFRAGLEVMDLKAVGLSAADVRSGLTPARLTPHRLRSRKIFMPDSRLPAPERLQQIMDGGIARKKEALFEGSTDVLALKLVEYLKSPEV